MFTRITYQKKKTMFTRITKGRKLRFFPIMVLKNKGGGRVGRGSYYNGYDLLKSATKTGCMRFTSMSIHHDPSY